MRDRNELLRTLRLSFALLSTLLPASLSVSPIPCAALYEDVDYKGHSHILTFPGSTSRIDLGFSFEQEQRMKSISVSSGCTALLWRKAINDDESEVLSSRFQESVPSIQDIPASFEWACCHCDESSRNVCLSSQKLTRNVTAPLPGVSGLQNDFSQFVKYSKKIVGIGRNYRWTKHEFKASLDVPKEPILFLKPSTSYIREGQKTELRRSLGAIYYEIELGVVIGKKGKNIPESEALDYVAGYFLALDMTAKGVIRSNRSNFPWEIGKGFDTACPVGKFVPKSLVPDPNNIHLEAKLNGVVTQSANTNEMIFNIQQLIAYTSRFMTLEPFDTMITGSPDGFGPMKEGDLVEGKMDNLSRIEFGAVSIP